MDDDAYWAARAEQMRNEETPIILRGDMLRVNFWGVPSNDPPPGSASASQQQREVE